MILPFLRLPPRTPTYSSVPRISFTLKRKILYPGLATLPWLGFHLELKDVQWKCLLLRKRWPSSYVKWLIQENISKRTSPTLYSIILGPSHLMLYSVVDLRYCLFTDTNNYTEVLVEVFLRKPLMGKFLTVFLPTALFLIIRQELHRKEFNKW